jgi:hypothetical protein
LRITPPLDIGILDIGIIVKWSGKCFPRIIRRHHITLHYPSIINDAIKAAVRKSGLLKRITANSFCHTYRPYNGIKLKIRGSPYCS